MKRRSKWVKEKGETTSENSLFGFGFRKCALYICKVNPSSLWQFSSSMLTMRKSEEYSI
jgi:hypothetical protein